MTGRALQDVKTKYQASPSFSIGESVVFSSFLFLFYFLPLTLGLYYTVPQTWRLGVLTLLSYVFYGWTNPLYVPLMWFSSSIDYVAGGIIAADATRATSQSAGGHTFRQRAALVISVSSNLALLGFFKYFNFGADAYRHLMLQLGWSEHVPDALWQITLPLGISFYTFQSLSYTIDIYRGEARPARSFLDFACYVSLFPQLVAGPIIRFQDLADQLIVRTHTAEKFSRGVLLFQLGLAKKVILANPCGSVAEAAFNAGTLECFQAWWGLLGYSLQIYFDFSGYSDMAIGLGLMFGFVFPENFNSPYLSVSFSEFWRRWHITLSTWLREYLYIPLGGNRHGRLRTYLNLFLVMLLGGLWHGAAWNFVIWGAYHGLLLAGERAYREIRGHRDTTPVSNRAIPRSVRVAAVFCIVALGWVLFRAHDIAHAGRYYAALAGLATPQSATALLWSLMFQPYHVLSLAAGAVVVWCCPTAWNFTAQQTWPKAAWAGILFLLSIVLLATQQYNPFIYFLF